MQGGLRLLRSYWQCQMCKWDRFLYSEERKWWPVARKQKSRGLVRKKRPESIPREEVGQNPGRS